MRSRDIVTAAVVGAVGVGFMVLASQLPSSGASRTALGPGVYPLVLGCLLLAAVAVFTATAARRRVTAPGQPTDDGRAPNAATETRWRQLLATFMATVIYVWLLGIVGFLFATTLFLAAGVRLIGGQGHCRGLRGFVVATLFGLVTASAIYMVFDLFLGVLLPPGLLLPTLTG